VFTYINDISRAFNYRNTKHKDYREWSLLRVVSASSSNPHLFRIYMTRKCNPN